MRDVLLELPNLLVLPLLAFDEDDRVVEALFQQMVLVVLTQDLDLAAQVVVRTLHELELADGPVAVEVLPLDLRAALVLTLDDLVKAASIVRLQVLVDDCRIAAVVDALDLAVGAAALMRLDVPPLELHRAAFFEEALALVRALDDLEEAVVPDVVHHLAASNRLATVVPALHFEVLAMIFDVLINLVKR